MNDGVYVNVVYVCDHYDVGRERVRQAGLITMQMLSEGVQSFTQSKCSDQCLSSLIVELFIIIITSHAFCTI